jgi:hypothetical protein
MDFSVIESFKQFPSNRFRIKKVSPFSYVGFICPYICVAHTSQTLTFSFLLIVTLAEYNSCYLREDRKI